MAVNNPITIQDVTQKCLYEFKNQLKVLRHFDFEFARRFGLSGHKIGSTLKVRRPQRWLAIEGALYSDQAINDTVTTVTIDQHYHVGFQWPNLEGVLSLDDVYDRYFKTAINQLANKADAQASLWAYRNTSRFVGVLGTNPSTNAAAQSIFLDAMATLTEGGADISDVLGALSPRFAAALMALLNTQFNPNTQISRQYLEGVLANAFGFQKIAIDQNVKRHTAGTGAFTGLTVKTSSANGDTSIVITGFTPGDTLNPGDTFVTESYDVNPMSRESTGQLKQFAVAGDLVLTADGSGDITVPLVYIGAVGLQGPDQQYQNVLTLPVAADDVVIWPGTTTPGTPKTGVQSLAFCKDAFACVPVQLDKLSALVCEQVTDPETGMMMMITKGGDIRSFQELNRIDIAFGFGNLNADQSSVRMVGA